MITLLNSHGVLQIYFVSISGHISQVISEASADHNQTVT